MFLSHQCSILNIHILHASVLKFQLVFPILSDTYGPSAHSLKQIQWFVSMKRLSFIVTDKTFREHRSKRQNLTTYEKELTLECSLWGHNLSHVSPMLENIFSVDYFSSILTIPSQKALSQASISTNDQKAP